MSPARSERLALAACAAATVAIAAYTALRMAAWWAGDPPPAAVGPSSHGAFAWRSLLGAWLGVCGGAFAWRFVAPDEKAFRVVLRTLAGVTALAICTLFTLP